MCDNINDYPKKDNIYDKFLQRLKSENGVITCKRCPNNGFVLLQQKDVFCRQCLYDYCCHKFRSTIGKSKAVHSGDRVLIAFSGGVNSSAMVDMIMDGLNDSQHKRLRFEPSVLHIDESIIREESPEETESALKEIRQLMSETNWKCYLSAIEMSYRESDTNFYVRLNEPSIDRQLSTDCRKAFMDSFSSIKSLTSRQEFLKRMRCRLICDIAKNENFDHIFVANSASNLAINLLSDVAVGKGIQLQSESGFIDTRNDVPILRPMREFTAKEVTFYALMRRLKFIVRRELESKTTLKSSIQRMTESFVNGLQTEFPSTVYTIFKTGNKLKASDKECLQKCIVCNSSIDTLDRPICSAFGALGLTQRLSNNLTSESSTSNQAGSLGDWPTSSSQLCYSCSIIANEMTGIEETFPKILRKKVDKKDLKEFLIDQNEDGV